jgi:ABC-type sugar transport system ATPase subunit
MAGIQLEDLHKTYPGGHVALRGVDLETAEGELLVLVGPSGCGKSSVLRLVAGLEAPSQGRVLVAGRDVTSLSPGERDVAMVFQSYALYPHKTVAENLAFPLRMRSVARAERMRRVREVAELLGLETVLERRPAQLSGGQRQRVALGRALVREPRAFLLDEPLSNLDARLRVEMRAELARLHRRLGATMLYVTHDQEEAMTLGDRVAVMRAGRLEQVAPPLELYRLPASVFVADFVGLPPINWLDAELESEGGSLRARGAGFAVPVSPLLAGGPRKLRLGVRPQDLEPVAPGPDGSPDLVGRVEVVEPLGPSLLVHLRREEGGGSLRLLAPAEARLAVGDRLGARLHPERIHVFDAETGRRIGPRPLP